MITAWRKSAARRAGRSGGRRRTPAGTGRRRSGRPSRTRPAARPRTAGGGSGRPASASSSSRRRPSIRRAEPGFWYSLMSSRIIRSPEPNRNSASALAISVLPVPVGPTNSRTACGRVGSVSPAFTSATRSTMHSTASGWPTTRRGEERPQRVDVEPLALVEQRRGSPERSVIVASTSPRQRDLARRAAHRLQQREQRARQRGVAEEVPAERERLAQHVAVRRGGRAASASVRSSLIGSTRTTSNASRTAGPLAHQPLVARRVDDPRDVHGRVGHPREQQVQRAARGFWRVTPA